MNDDTDSENDLEDISLQEEWVTKYCSPAQLWSLMCDVEDGTANKEGVERAMEYYCYLWEKRQVTPPGLSKLIVTIFRKYLRGKNLIELLKRLLDLRGNQEEPEIMINGIWILQ